MPDSFIASVTLPASAESDAGGGPLDIPFNCIPTAPVRAVLGVKESVRWVFKYDPETGVSTLSQAADNNPGNAERLQGRVVASSTDCPDMAFSADEPSQQSFYFGITKAFAADFPIGKAIDWLEADSPLSRREARNALIGHGIPAVQPMMKVFSKPSSSYRTRLGSLVALNGMLHRKDITAGEVQTLLSNTDIKNIAKMSAVKDATMRRHASNVLAKLDDPRTVDAILSTFPHASDAAQSDLIAAIRPTYKKLSDDRKEAIAERLKNLTRDRPAQTHALIEQTTKAGLPNAQEENLYVVVGAFTKLANAQRLAKWIGKNSSQKAAVTKQRPGDPLYRVVVGAYTPRAEAEEIKQSVLASGAVNDVFLSNYPDVLRQ
ncbi:MAG: SPOR domain-containing protein [Rhizobiaceae bacterium]